MMYSTHFIYGYMHHPTDRIVHTPVMEHWLEQEIAQWVHHEGSIQGPTVP